MTSRISPLRVALIQRLLANERSCVLLICLAGISERLIWLSARPNIGSSLGETENAAIAFARTTSISDPFGRGSGLTAHVNPVLPAFAGGLYKVFGIQGAAAEIILMAFSLAFVFGSAVLLYRSFRSCGSSRISCTTGLILFSTLPLNFSLELLDFRVWEGAMATFLMSASLLVLIELDKTRSVAWPQIGGFSTLAAITLFMNPAAGLAAYVGAVIFMMRRMTFARAIQSTFIATLILAAVLLPWSIRNYIAFHQIIPLRSNAGLELALANHSGVTDGRREREVFVARLHEIHPLTSEAAFDKMQQSGGEKAYADHLGTEALGWITSHPGPALQNSLNHWKQFYFPPAWQWNIYSNTSKAVEFRLTTVYLISLLGLISACFAAFWWRGQWVYIASFALIPSIPYIVTQPVPRYRYLTFGLLLFLGTRFVAWSFGSGFRRRMVAAA